LGGTLLDEVLRMPTDMRARVTTELLGSFSGEFELSPEQLEEIERRLEELENGTVETYDFREVMQQIADRLHDRGGLGE
jgi:hypothetical protein